MSDKVKLIVTLSKGQYENLKDIQFGSIVSRVIFDAVKNGIPLDSNDSDYAEAQAYFDGQAYGWEEGRKALIDDVKAEIKKNILDEPVENGTNAEMACYNGGLFKCLEIIDNIGKGDKE